jgi:3-hydroxymyristoyl/3-hydroxydecanoyl-(acyl carrier protein) dehydratase
MRWFRANIRFGSRLALFALAVQVVLSFGHVHFSDLVGASGANVVVAASVDAPAKKAPGHQPGTPVDPGCAICALIQLASTSTPSTAPVVLPPTLLGLFKLDTPEQAAFAASPPASFRARAPPVV